MTCEEDARGKLVAIEFLDKENISLLKVGCYVEYVAYSYHEVILADDERIVGIRSGLRDNTRAVHYDF